MISDNLQRIEEYLLSICIWLIALLTILNVGCRAILGFSLAFAAELTQFCVIAVCFIGLSYAASKGRHIRMTAIYDQLPSDWRKRLMVAISATTAAVMFVLASYAIRYVATVYELGAISPALRVPYFAVFCFAPLGLILAGLQYTLALVRNLSSRDTYLSFTVKDEYEQPITQEI